MRAFILAAIALSASLSISEAKAYVYQKASIQSVKPIVLKDSNGSTTTLVSGPASLEVESYGFFSGDGEIKITTAQGTVRVTIPRRTFKSGWEFFAPASETGQSVSIRGWSSKQVTHGEPREEVVSCNIAPYKMPVYFNDGSPVTYTRVDPVTNKKERVHLHINLCAQIVNGKTLIKQVGPYDSCAGHQRVVKQTTTTTEVFTIEFLNPADGKVVGRIDASASSGSTQDLTVSKLTACMGVPGSF